MHVHLQVLACAARPHSTSCQWMDTTKCVTRTSTARRLCAMLLLLMPLEPATNHQPPTANRQPLNPPPTVRKLCAVDALAAGAVVALIVAALAARARRPRRMRACRCVSGRQWDGVASLGIKVVGGTYPNLI